MSEAWQKAWREHVSDIPTLGSQIHYTASAERLRRLVREGPLRLTDLRDNPEHFFLAHRLLSEHATSVGPGFGIRFTVQVNLFAGTILALGNPEQVQFLETVQKEGRLGCFCLTERLAGVNSGLVVNTIAEWDEARQQFRLHCPDEGAQKNWISQGLTADHAVVVANLLVGGKSLGPHAFVTDLRKDGQLLPGISAEDMGDKTIGNDLDNARISFTDVWLPKTSLLDRYAGFDGNAYVQRVKGTSNIDMIGQRLYTGRTVIADSTLVFSRSLFKRARQYTDKKRCWNPQGSVSLSDIPQLASLFVEADQQLGRLEAFREVCETRLVDCLRHQRLPEPNLVQQIAVLKVKAIETSINLCFKLKQELGSYALMGGTGFEKMDYLQCCKFAEGDSRILMQKIARDRLQAFAKQQDGSKEEIEICSRLGMAMMNGNKLKAWNENWQQVYALAEVVMEKVIEESLQGTSKAAQAKL